MKTKNYRHPLIYLLGVSEEKNKKGKVNGPPGMTKVPVAFGKGG
jgi:hypothetical protein